MPSSPSLAWPYLTHGLCFLLPLCSYLNPTSPFAMILYYISLHLLPLSHLTQFTASAFISPHVSTCMDAYPCSYLAFYLILFLLLSFLLHLLFPDLDFHGLCFMLVCQSLAMCFSVSCSYRKPLLTVVSFISFFYYTLSLRILTSAVLDCFQLFRCIPMNAFSFYLKPHLASI